MKTEHYNPSPLEVKFAKALHEVCGLIEERMDSIKIDKIECETQPDNPFVKFYIRDEDNDPHQIVFKIIQLPDTF
jgi:hypothetical protein